jgi:rubrerythrin
MNRAQRLLTLAYKAHQRNEPEISGRIVTLAFAEPEAADLFERINAAPTSDTEGSDEEQTEDTLRAAEAATKGNVFSKEGVSTLLSIAEKAHNAGLPKVAKLIAETATS